MKQRQQTKRKTLEGTGKSKKEGHKPLCRHRNSGMPHKDITLPPGRRGGGGERMEVGLRGEPKVKDSKVSNPSLLPNRSVLLLPNGAPEQPAFLSIP
jgi:hypothetical protein